MDVRQRHGVACILDVKAVPPSPPAKKFLLRDSMLGCWSSERIERGERGDTLLPSNWSHSSALSLAATLKC